MRDRLQRVQAERGGAALVAAVASASRPVAPLVWPDQAQRGNGPAAAFAAAADVGVGHAQERGLGIGAGRGGVVAARGR